MPDIYMGDPNLRRAVSDRGTKGSTAEAAYLDRAMGFDANRAVRDAAQGGFNQFRKQLGRDLHTLRGRQVGMGRLNTGFATQDEDRLIEGGLQNLNNQILQNAMGAASLNLRNTEGLGQYGAAQSGTYLDALTGLNQTRRAQELQNRASKRGFWGNLAGGLMSGIGAAGGIGAFFSDEDLKEGIKEIDDALGKVRKLKGVEWDWNEIGQALTGEKKRRKGVIAQDVEKVAPELVGRRGGYRTVDYQGLTGVLTEAVKELDRKLSKLEKAA